MPVNPTFRTNKTATRYIKQCTSKKCTQFKSDILILRYEMRKNKRNKAGKADDITF